MVHAHTHAHLGKLLVVDLAVLVDVGELERLRHLLLRQRVACVCVCVCVWFEPRRVLLTEGGREGEKERRVCGGDIETDDDTERDENVTQLVRVDLAYIYIYI